MKGVKAMPTLRSKVMMKAMLMNAPALTPMKIRTRETRGKRFFKKAKAECFEHVFCWYSSIHSFWVA